MIGRQNRWQEDLFVAGQLSSLIPQDHILKQVDKVLALSWLREELQRIEELFNSPAVPSLSSLSIIDKGNAFTVGAGLVDLELGCFFLV